MRHLSGFICLQNASNWREGKVRTKKRDPWYAGEKSACKTARNYSRRDGRSRLCGGGEIVLAGNDSPVKGDRRTTVCEYIDVIGARQRIVVLFAAVSGRSSLEVGPPVGRAAVPREPAVPGAKRYLCVVGRRRLLPWRQQVRAARR